MVLSRRLAVWVLAAGSCPGKLLAEGVLERLQLHARPRPSPDFTLHDAAGSEVASDAFSGQGLVLNFWATWCPPCVEEMPALARLAAALAGEGVRVVAASQDRGGVPVVRAFYERVGISGLPIWLDPRGAAGRAFGIRGLPTTVILDRDRSEVARLEGAAAWDAPRAIARIRELVAPAPAGSTRAAVIDAAASPG
ncbi:MAG: TlpA family protein disulfide reductase [Acetobacteraceae bacterium]|nr:TlpA family protein disulfide reductase [Acetobacteraceae bacterium]